MTRYLFYCRQGYEADLAKEIEWKLAEFASYGYAKFSKDKAFIEFIQQNSNAFPNFEKLIFARQKIKVLSSIAFESTHDRISSVLHTLEEQGALPTFGEVYVEHADNESGKELAKFCKKFTVPLRSRLRQRGLLTKKQNLELPFLHLFFENSASCLLGMSMPNDRSLLPMGIQRLRMPSDAPSRSTLKLEEAIKIFYSDEQQSLLFSSGMTAVDLGACPGGWTYQLVKRGLKVEAIDNGMIDANLMATGLVQHFQTDGFKYQPQDKHVDWLVCDMIEKPDKVSQLMLDWLQTKKASATIFNLKLPMKQRFDVLNRLLQGMRTSLQAKTEVFMQAKHLYHDRDEITVTIVCNPELYGLPAEVKI